MYCSNAMGFYLPCVVAVVYDVPNIFIVIFIVAMVVKTDGGTILTFDMNFG